jgi:RHS repeat-associated protein
VAFGREPRALALVNRGPPYMPSFLRRCLFFVLMALLPARLACADRNMASPDDAQKLTSPVQPFPGGASVDALSGGLSIDVPIYSRPLSATLALSLNLHYSSKDQWYRRGQSGYATYWWGPLDQHQFGDFALPSGAFPIAPDGRPDAGALMEAGWGWQFALGRIGFSPGDPHSKYVILSDGIPHKLYQMGANNSQTAHDADNESQTAITRDGSRFRATWVTKPGSFQGNYYGDRIYKVFAPDGTIYEFGHWYDQYRCESGLTMDDVSRKGWHVTAVVDPSGNRIDVEYHVDDQDPYNDHIIKRIVDTEKHVVDVELTSGYLSPILNNLIHRITFATQSGTASVELDYGSASTEVHAPPSPNSHSVWDFFQVAQLHEIRLPEGVTHAFEYNQHGELRAHVLPTGGRVEYVHETSLADGTFAERHGRGVTSVKIVPEPSAPSDSYDWGFFRNEDTDCKTRRASIRDPQKMWRTLTYIPPQQCDIGPRIPSSLVQEVTIWDRPFDEWPGYECGIPPAGVLPFRTIANKWELDDWSLVSTEWDGYHNFYPPACEYDREPRLVYQKVTEKDGSWRSDSHCGWDGFGHHEFTGIRGAAAGVGLTPRFEQTRHSPLVCQWILDLPTLERVSESGMASVIERRYTQDGRLSLEVRHIDRATYPPVGTPPDELADHQCDRSGEDDLSWSGMGRFVEQRLDDEPNFPNVTTIVGQWQTQAPDLESCHNGVDDDGDTLVDCMDPGCPDLRYVQDTALHGLPGVDPAPPLPSTPAGCNCYVEFAIPVGLPTIASGDVVTSNTYYASLSGAEADREDSHGHRAWGQLETTTFSGGDPLPGYVPVQHSSYTKSFEWACGSVHTEQWQGMDWLLKDQDVQCDVPDVPTSGPSTGLVLASRDPAGFTTRFTYDALRRTRRVEPAETLPVPDGGAQREAPTTFTYSSDLRRSVTSKRPDGGTPEEGTDAYETFDGIGRLVMKQERLTASALATHVTKYDGLNRPTSETAAFTTSVPHALSTWPEVALTVYVDSLGLPDPDRRWLRKYAPDGSLASRSYVGLDVYETRYGINDAVNATTRFEHDPLGRLVHVDAPDDAGDSLADAHYSYDALDLMVAAELMNAGDVQSREWTYDGASRLRSMTMPESGTTLGYSYDALGQPLGWTDADGRVHWREHDAAGRTTAAGDVVGGDHRPLDLLFYDDPAAGFAAGRLTSTQTNQDLGQLVPVVQKTFTYAGLSGRLSALIEVHQDGFVGTSYGSHFAYDALGLASDVTYPRPFGMGVEFTLVHGREFGRLTTLGTPSDPDAFVRDASYDSNGALAWRDLGSGLDESRSYDSNDRLQRIQVGPLGAIFDSGPMSYDGAGNIRSFGRTATRPGYDNFTYDLGGRLVAAEYFGVGRYVHSYDGFGNMTGQALEDPVAGCMPHELNRFENRRFHLGQDNQPTSSVTNRISALGVDPGCFPVAAITYSNSGEVLEDETAAYEYDAMSRLTSRATTAGSERFAYDVNGWRAWLETSTTTGVALGVRHYLRGSDGKVLYEYGEDLAYIYFDGELVATRKHPFTGTVIDEWNHVDHLGSTRATSDAAGTLESSFDVGAFGVDLPRGANSGGPRFFAGHLRDGDDSVDYMMARYFSSRHSRFLSVDPAEADVAQPASFNRYTYASNSPLTSVDLDGKSPTIPLAIGGAVVGGFINMGLKVLKNKVEGKDDLFDGCGKAFVIGAVATGVAIATVGVGTAGLAWLGAGETVTTLGAGAFAGAVGSSLQGAANDRWLDGNKDWQHNLGTIPRNAGIGALGGLGSTALALPVAESFGTASSNAAFAGAVAGPIVDAVVGVMDYGGTEILKELQDTPGMTPPPAKP